MRIFAAASLRDFEWSIIKPLLPNKPRVDDRPVLNGIYWRLRTGSPWADIPERYGPYTTCYKRLYGGRNSAHGTGYSMQYQKLMKVPNNPWTVRPSAFISTGPTQKGGRSGHRQRRSG